MTIRPATPDDAPFLAWVVQTAARSHLTRGVWDDTFPGEEAARLTLLAEMITHDEPTFLRYDGFLVSEADGQPAAALSHYDPGEKNDDAFLNALIDVMARADWTAERQRDAGAALLGYTVVQPDLAPGLWVVEWVATDPAHRGRGHVRRLLDRVLELGRDSGATEAEISILIGNEPARAAYVAAGFSSSSIHEDDGFAERVGCPGIESLTRTL